MWTDQHQQFVEAAARTLWVREWADHEERALVLRSLSGQELTDIAPPTPDYARMCAAMLLGKIEQANGCELAVIIEAASAADFKERSATGQPLHEIQTIDVAEFASDCALMAVGSGVNWFDDHAKFRLHNSRYWCSKDGPCTNPSCAICTVSFVVPSIEFTYEGTE